MAFDIVFVNEFFKIKFLIIKKINKLVVPSIRHAAMTGEVIRDFSKLVVIPKDQNNEPKPLEIRPFTKEEQKIFEASIKNEPLSPLYLTALYSGIRRGQRHMEEHFPRRLGLLQRRIRRGGRQARRVRQYGGL